MSVLTCDLIREGPDNILFLRCDEPHQEFKVEERERFAKSIFYEMPDQFTLTITSLIRQPWIFDVFESIEYNHHEELYALYSGWLSLMSRLSICPVVYFEREIGLYESFNLTTQNRSGIGLKGDMMDTMLFLSTEIQKTINEKKCLKIIGV